MNLSTFARKVEKRVLALPARIASQVIEAAPVKAKLETAYRGALRQHRPHLPTLSRADRDIVDTLEATGVHVTSLDALRLPDTSAFFTSAQALANDYFERSRRGELRYWDACQASAQDILGRREIFYWGLNARLLNIAETYLGLPVGYDGINVFYTKADGRQVGARKWHLDVEDRRMLKVVVYLNDVDDDGGPFQVLLRDLPGSDGSDKPARAVLTQEKLVRAFGGALQAKDIATCVGPAGTVVFSDTARLYHRGKPAVARDRCTVFFNYMSRAPLRPFFCERGTLSRTQIETLASDVGAGQRDALLWRRSLPLVARMVPPAPIG